MFNTNNTRRRLVSSLIVSPPLGLYNLQLFKTSQQSLYHSMVVSLLNYNHHHYQQQQHHPSNHNQHYAPNHGVPPLPSHHHHFQQHHTQQQENIIDHLVSDLKKERRKNKRNKIAILLLFISLGLLSYEYWQLRQTYDQRFGFEDLNKLFRNEPSRLESYLPPWIQENLKKNKKSQTNDKVDVESEEVKKWVNIAKTLKNQKEYEDAIRILENILWKYPSNFHARELYGLIFLDKGQYRAALRQFDQACQFAISPNSEASCYNNIGVCFSRLKLDKEAVEAYDKALNIAQFDAKNRGLFYFNRAISHNTLGNLQSAIQDYTRAIQFDEQDHAFLSKKYRFRAGCYTTLKQYQKALDDLNLSIQHQKDDKTNANLKAELFYFRAKTQRKLKNYQECITDIDKSINLKKNDANYFHTRAVAMRKMGNFQKAEEDHNMAIQIKPNNSKFKSSLEKTRKLAQSTIEKQQQSKDIITITPPPPQEQEQQPPSSENKAD